MKLPSTGARRSIVDEIDSALDLAMNGIGPRTLVVTAGPGSGKSHTLRRLVSGRGIETRWATADELSWRQPYAVAAALIGVAVPATAPAGFDTELHAAVDSLCAIRPQLLVVDDAHNADAGSLEVLSHLAAAAKDLPLVVLVARRHLPTRELLTRMLARPTVREWNLPAMDAADLEVLAHEVLGAWPDAALSTLLARSGGNPMHALTMLTELRAQGTVVVKDGRATAPSMLDASASSSLESAIAEQLSLLDASSRDLVRKLAVWGGPATLAELADLGDTSAAVMVGAAQTVIDAGMVDASPSGELTFTHDVYADVAYDGLAPPLRAILHTEVARHHEAAGNRQMVAHHLLAAGGDESVLGAAVSRAQEELQYVPAVAVDLLGTATATVAGSFELDLATALARSGQLARSAEVATQGLSNATDPAVVPLLYRTLLFTSIAQGKSQHALGLISSTLQMPVDDATRAGLLDTQRYVSLLEGVTPVPGGELGAVHGPVSVLVTEALRRFLSGAVDSGLNLALEASQQEGAVGAGFQLSTSADVWPPFIELYAHGPVAAEALMDRAQQLRTDRGAAWMTAYQDFTRGGIAMKRGRLDDAAAHIDAGLERAGSADMGWTSIAEGTRAQIDVYRGDVEAALARLDAFENSGQPHQFGLPICGMTRVSLLESGRKLLPAVAAARRYWGGARELGIYGWLPSFAVDCARLARRTDDGEFAAEIVDTLAEISDPLPVASVGPVALARALCAGDSESVVAQAVRSAESARREGNVIAEAAAWEEAACELAASGDKVTAREHARTALLITQNMGATALSSRIAMRLRPLGVRLDPRTVRERPRTGWDSLTRTETTIADMVASGRSGPEIAQSLFISQRTVQTHVSHALTKLGLRTRVELAALVAGRRE
ncbi:helix-turn-helix transcriptional regulator [Rhodococcoides fascians]|uniref:helix-turn-helix transcriptional regulator n=1 Tax=Rhodococcoides fascians TaxID=1828 RepID=UPI00056A681A|nr:LuxR family transcriptional regulator [Rhodococcus fascians]